MMQSAAIKKPEMLTVRQAARRGILPERTLPERTLRRLVAQNKIPIVRSGKTAYLNYALQCEQLNKFCTMPIWSAQG